MPGLKLVARADDERACALDSNAKNLVRKIKMVPLRVMLWPKPRRWFLTIISLNQKVEFRSDCVSNSLVELTRQEAADVEITLLACHLAAPTLAVPDERLAILVRHVEHGIVGNVDPLALKHDLVVVVARLNDCLGRPAVRAATASLLTRQAIEPVAGTAEQWADLQSRDAYGDMGTQRAWAVAGHKTISTRRTTLIAFP